MRKLKNYKPTKFKAKDSYYDKEYADFAVAYKNSMEVCENEIQLRKCPKCGKIFGERGAVSRVDNVTIVCSDCGTREALESIGVDETE